MNKLFIILSLCALVACERAPSSYEFTKEDEALLDSIQRQTLNYFTVFAEPNTGLARERDRHQEGNIVTTGGTGFGIMAIIAGAERGFLPKEEATERISKIANSLDKMERFHGAWAHWYDGDTGEPFSFSKYDDGGDLVETALLMQGVLTARQWTDDQELKELCDKLWKGVEWDWHTAEPTPYWHWVKIIVEDDHAIRYFDETLITACLLSSPTHTISRHCRVSYKPRLLL